MAKRPYILVQSMNYLKRNFKYSKENAFHNSCTVAGGVMEEITIHAYLHKKNALAAELLSNSLKAMNKEGVLKNSINC